MAERRVLSLHRRKRLESILEKGQSTLEYLVTYGWMLLALVIIAFILWYSGVFDPLRVFDTKYSTGFYNFVVHDFKLDTNGDLVIVLGNSAGASMAGINFSMGASTECSANVIPAEGKVTCIVRGVTGGGELNEKFFSIPLTGSYSDARSGLSHTISGELYGEYEPPDATPVPSPSPSPTPTPTPVGNFCGDGSCNWNAEWDSQEGCACEGGSCSYGCAADCGCCEGYELSGGVCIAASTPTPTPTVTPSPSPTITFPYDPCPDFDDCVNEFNCDGAGQAFCFCIDGPVGVACPIGSECLDGLCIVPTPDPSEP